MNINRRSTHRAIGALVVGAGLAASTLGLATGVASASPLDPFPNVCAPGVFPPTDYTCKDTDVISFGIDSNKSWLSLGDEVTGRAVVHWFQRGNTWKAGLEAAEVCRTDDRPGQAYGRLSVYQTGGQEAWAKQKTAIVTGSDPDFSNACLSLNGGLALYQYLQVGPTSGNLTHVRLKLQARTLSGVVTHQAIVRSLPMQD